MDWRSWNRRQIAVGGPLALIFVLVASILPVLITRERPSHPVAAAGPTPMVTRSAAVTPTPTPMATVSPPPPPPPPSPLATPLSLVLHPAVKPRPVEDPPDRAYREFQSVCASRRQTSRAPVSGLYRAGTSIRYLVFGSTSTKLADPGQIPGGSTSCLNAADRSTYWLPMLEQAGRAVPPDTFTVLYKGTVDDYTSVQAFPPGMRIFAGGASSPASTPAQGAVSWTCTGYSASTLPPSCPAGDRLTLRLSSPNCWDGRHLDVPGHRSHLTWAIDGRCPADHPVAVPTLLVDVIYPLKPSGALRLSSGPSNQFGFGFVSGWKTTDLAHLVNTCINAGRQCDTQGRPT